MRKLQRFILLPSGDRALLVHSFRSLVVWRLGLWLLPVRILRQRSRAIRRIRRPRPADRVVWAVRAAARYVPSATCLTQALAVQSLLARSGHSSQLHIGVAKGLGREFGAHAWVRCGDRVVIGGADLDRYTPLLFWEEGPR
jgi:Transglutaminase-like superfamily